MAKTYLFTCDAIDPDEQVIARSRCKTITISEDNSGITAGFLVREPTSLDPQLQVPAGGRYTFCAPFDTFYSINQVVGTIKAASGSLSIAQVES
jgi:hypothetical protein